MMDLTMDMAIATTGTTITVMSHVAPIALCPIGIPSGVNGAPIMCANAGRHKKTLPEQGF